MNAAVMAWFSDNETSNSYLLLSASVTEISDTASLAPMQPYIDTASKSKLQTFSDGPE